MRFLSLFSGIEAASSAWLPLGWECAGVAEIEAFPCAVLDHHHGCGPAERVPDPGPRPPSPNMIGLSEDEQDARRPAWDAWSERTAQNKSIAALPPRRAGSPPNLGDVTAPDFLDSAAALLPDVIIGGSPCQSFSVAGLRESMNDARGNLSLRFVQTIEACDAARLARGLPPVIALWENVPGVLSTSDNAFGCILAAMVGADAALVPPRKLGWTNAGVVAGPRRVAAWRILDAQFFRLAQRRRRVFVVASAREGFDPASVLLERAGMRRNPPTRGAAREDVAGSLGASTGGSDENDAEQSRLIHAREPLCDCGHDRNAHQGGADEDCIDCSCIKYLPPPATLAFGGNRTSGPVDVASALQAHGGGHGRQDFASETFVTHSLRGGGFDASEDGTGRRTPLVAVPILEVGGGTSSRGAGPNGAGIGEAGDPMLTLQSGHQHAVAVALRGRGGGATAELAGDRAHALRASKGGGDKPHVLAFDAVLVTSKANRSNQQPGDPSHPPAAGAPPAIGFHNRQDPDSGPVTHPLGAKDNGLGVAQPGAQVRRLMPVECERLQGFQDGHTDVPYNGKPASDGPRYRALGNSMAVPVIRWIGERIDAAAGVH